MLYVNLISVLKKEANSSILDNNDFQGHSHIINSSIMSLLLTLLSTFILFYLQFSNKVSIKKYFIHSFKKTLIE